MAKTPENSKLAKANERVAALKAENDLRVEMLAASQKLTSELGRRLSEALGLIRAAADQFEVRQAAPTAAHYRARADALEVGDLAKPAPELDLTQALRTGQSRPRKSR